MFHNRLDHMLKAYGLTPIRLDSPIQSSGPHIYIYDVKKYEIRISSFVCVGLCLHGKGVLWCKQANVYYKNSKRNKPYTKVQNMYGGRYNSILQFFSCMLNS